MRVVKHGPQALKISLDQGFNQGLITFVQEGPSGGDIIFEGPAVKTLVTSLRDLYPEEAEDGYHTMAELYHYRMLYNALLFNEWANDEKYSVSKSFKHSDGEDCFGGEYFVVYAYIPHIGQITNHYKKEYWDLFQVQPLPKAPPFDNHTPKDAADRMMQYLKQATPRFYGFN